MGRNGCAGTEASEVKRFILGCNFLIEGDLASSSLTDEWVCPSIFFIVFAQGCLHSVTHPHATVPSRTRGAFRCFTTEAQRARRRLMIKSMSKITIRKMIKSKRKIKSKILGTELMCLWSMGSQGRSSRRHNLGLETGTPVWVEGKT